MERGYWICRTRIYLHGKSEIVAKLMTPTGRDERQYYCGEGEDRVFIQSPRQTKPYGVDLKLTFMVNPKHRLVDNYATYTGFSLFSKRLVDLVREFGVKFETFPVRMVDKGENELKDMEYYVFHLLEPNLDAMDKQKSKWVDFDKGIPILVLDLDNFEHRPMFVCNDVFLTLMRDDLRNEISRRGITGFSFLDPALYQSGEFGFAEDYGD